MYSILMSAYKHFCFVNNSVFIIKKTHNFKLVGDYIEFIMSKLCFFAILLQTLNRFVVVNGSDSYGIASYLQINESGSDHPECLLGIDSCQSLAYILNSSMNVYRNNIPLTVLVSVSQNIENIFEHQNILNLNMNNLVLIGSGYPTLQFTNKTIWKGDHNFVNFTSLRFRGFQIIGSVKLFDGNFIEFYNCTHDVSVRGWFYNVREIQFLFCSFNNSNYGNRPGLQFVLVKYVSFSDCSFGPVLPTNNDVFANSHLLDFAYFRKNYTEDIAFLSATNAVNISRCRFQNVNIPIIQLKSADEIYNWSIFLSIYDSLFYNNTNIYTTSLIAGDCLVTIRNSSFLSNKIYVSGDTSVLQLKTYELENVTFHSNLGAALLLAFGRELWLVNVNIINNTGVHSGGIIVSNTMSYQEQSAHFINVSFHNNKYTAANGGTIYIQTHTCLSTIVSLCHVNFVDKSQFIFFSDYRCAQQFVASIETEGCKRNKQKLKTLPHRLKFMDTTVNVFPGQYIPISPIVTDYYNNTATCIAIPSLEMMTGFNDNDSNQTTLKDEVRIKGNTKIYLQTTNETIRKELFLVSNGKHSFPLTNFKIIFTCPSVSGYLNVTLTMCPLGYTFIHKICKKTTNNSAVIYDETTGAVCIRNKYWYGRLHSDNSTVFTVAPCDHVYCGTNGEPCIIDGYVNTHHRLPATQDQQCNSMYGGVLCRSCKENAVFTFGASKCIFLSECRQHWHPYTVVATAVVCQIILALLIIVLVPTSKTGVGYLYGPMFFLAVCKLQFISLDLYTVKPVEIILSLYHSILFLDLDVFGKLPWCFFPGLNQTLNYSLRFFGPLIAFGVLIVVAVTARSTYCYRKTSRFFRSPVQSMCLLMILSFWSVSNTSIEILQPILVSNQWRFAIQPEYKYLKNKYSIGLWCVSVILLLAIYVPFIILLFFSQCLRKRMNLFRIQPLLDAFQSSYKDNCQWYSGVYLLSWVVLNINVTQYEFIFISILATICLLHFLVQPHKGRFMNITDTILLIDLLLLSSLSIFCGEGYPETVMTVMKVTLVAIPLLYILAGGIWVMFRQMMINCVAKLRLQLRPPVNQIAESPHQSDDTVDVVLDREDRNIHSEIKKCYVCKPTMEREPLIYDDNDDGDQ